MPEVDAQVIKKSRPPERVLRGEDFPLEENGETYYPHAGEHIHLQGQPSNGFLQDLVRFGYLLALAKEAGGMLDLAEGSELDLLFDRVRSELSDHIVRWTWTDASGRKLPVHPSPMDIRKITTAELLGIAYAFIPKDLSI